MSTSFVHISSSLFAFLLLLLLLNIYAINTDNYTVICLSKMVSLSVFIYSSLFSYTPFHGLYVAAVFNLH